MKLKLKPNFLLVFAVRYQQKFKGFFTPQKQSFADYYELMPVWIADMGPDCRCVAEGVGLGAKGFVKDAFELEGLPSYITEIYAPLVDFKDEILKAVDDTAGIIQPCVIHESALMAITEESWKKHPRLSWDQPSSAKPFSDLIYSGEESSSSVSGLS